jgi:hypothetical protein
VHSAALVANIIEGDSRVLFYPAESAPNANARGGDGDQFSCHDCLSVDAGDKIDKGSPSDTSTRADFLLEFDHSLALTHTLAARRTPPR